MKPIRYARTISVTCLLTSVALTYWAYSDGLAQALVGQSPNWLVHIGAFVVAVLLVLVSIVVFYARNDNF